MQQSEPSYDIHEKIAQLETELLQHELLIRRQKHVISSLKTMITSPQRTWNSSNEAAIQNTVRNVVTSVAPTARSKATPLQPTVPAPAAQSSSNITATPRKKTAGTNAVVERPINMHKKKSAIRKVYQYCATIPKFGAAVAPKRKRTSVNIVEDNDVQGNKRSRALHGTEAATAASASAAIRTNGSSSSSTSSSGQRRASHSSVAALSAEEEDAEDLADEEAFLATAGAKLSYLNAMRAQSRSSLNNTSNSSNGTGSSSGGIGAQQRVSPRPVMVPVQLRPSATTSLSTTSQLAAARSSVVSGTSKSSHSVTHNNTTSSNSNAMNSSSSGKPKTNTDSNTNSIQRPTTSATSNTSNNSSKTLNKPVIQATPTNNKHITTNAITTTAATTNGLYTPVTTNNNSSFASSVSITSPITSPRNLLTGSTHKNKAIYEYCQQVRSLEDKLEVAKDMHFNILSNPRRLQQFLDSTGGRDLFLSWLTEGMERVQAGDLRADEELAQTKLMEYTVLLINQAYWNAKSVSELKFDKTLKALYRLFEDRRGPHHVTVSNIVKGIWPSYRIMRKQHEASGKEKGNKNSSNVFVVD